MDNKKIISKQVLFGIIGISSFCFFILIISFVFFFSSPKEIRMREIDGGDVSMTYTDDINELSIINAVPTTDSLGMSQNGADKYFDFTIKTDVLHGAKTKYEIALIKDRTNSTAMDDNIKVYLEKQVNGTYVECFGPTSFKALTKKSKIGSPKGSMLIAEVENKKSKIENYRLRMWIADTALIPEGVTQNYSVHVVVNGMAK